MKDNGEAITLWGGDVYDAIPKDVFALMAWHLANLASLRCDQAGAAEERALEEIEALADNGAISATKVKRIKAALSVAVAKALEAV